MKNIILSCLLLLFVACDKCNIYKEREIKKVIIKMVNGIDSKDWKVSTEQFTDEVFVDYSSLSGQPGSVVKSKDLVGGWEKLLTKASTHHMLTNFDIKIDDETAEVFSHVYASHIAPNIAYWDAYGRYHHKLKKTKDGWKINFMKLIMHGQKGNSNFLGDLQKK